MRPHIHWDRNVTPHGEWVEIEAYQQLVDELKRVAPDSKLLKALGELDDLH